ncbi:MAG: hypothetical protein HS101_17885 [Planctomycetia bacterium]|nr:hypothetical protein [Planctomycetia bacterium]MCC7313609.1 hypothetical protein [Planctomycetota bacterium]OQZ06379.1 MAG: hypothetical protein B6D36_05355 [Planctomycetes bacterium UTPLA1]
MRQSFTRQNLRNWSAPLLGLLAIVFAAGFAVTRPYRLEKEINELAMIGATLNQSAQVLERTVTSPEQRSELREKMQDLTLRAEEARKPGLLQAELMQTARNGHLEVREILPVSTGHIDTSRAELPKYRVSVAGSYRQIAEYMEACTRQRIPARVRSFRVSHATNPDGSPSGLLLAEITVEGFLLQESPQNNEHTG